MQMLFQNDQFVAVDKPGGWLSVPSRLGAADERPCLGRILEVELGVRLWPVHRLDEEVTGLILFALNAAAHRAAGKWFEDHVVGKAYEAFTDGVSPEGRGPWVWRSQLLRGKRRAYASPHGKPAETEARIAGKIALKGDALLHWRLLPHTGRPHQLRYELAHHGYPIVGDELYGSKKTFVKDSIALRCVGLDFGNCPEAKALGLPRTLEAPELASLLEGEVAP